MTTDGDSTADGPLHCGLFVRHRDNLDHLIVIGAYLKHLSEVVFDAISVPSSIINQRSISPIFTHYFLVFAVNKFRSTRSYLTRLVT